MHFNESQCGRGIDKYYSMFTCLVAIARVFIPFEEFHVYLGPCDGFYNNMTAMCLSVPCFFFGPGPLKFPNSSEFNCKVIQCNFIQSISTNRKFDKHIKVLRIIRSIFAEYN